VEWSDTLSLFLLLYVCIYIYQVLAVEWSDTPTYRTPHRVTLEAALDNLVEPEHLPLAPWY
jgi:hypothetical protein